MTQLNFLNGQSKVVRVIAYLILGALITGYAGASGWVFTQVINRPMILENYQKKDDALKQEIKFKEELLEHKTNTVKRIDRLEDYISGRFNHLDTLILDHMKQNNTKQNKEIIVE